MTDLILSHLDWLALALSTVGTILWAQNGRHTKYAAVYWLAASVAWMAYGVHTDQAALSLREALSAALFLYGGYRWLLKREPERRSAQAN